MDSKRQSRNVERLKMCLHILYDKVFPGDIFTGTFVPTVTELQGDSLRCYNLMQHNSHVTS
jgi:hypothetical protein